MERNRLPEIMAIDPYIYEEIDGTWIAYIIDGDSRVVMGVYGTSENMASERAEDLIFRLGKESYYEKKVKELRNTDDSCF